MPRFHFNVFDGITSIDRDGTQLADLHQAKRQAMLVVAELMRNEASCPKAGEDWRVEVTDGRGMILFRIDVMLNETPATRSERPFGDALS